MRHAFNHNATAKAVAMGTVILVFGRFRRVKVAATTAPVSAAPMMKTGGLSFFNFISDSVLSDLIQI
jgi:hypothetical protein